MIKMIIAPLLFSTLVVGIAGSGDLKIDRAGSASRRSSTSRWRRRIVAVRVSLVLVNLLQAGRRAVDAARRRHDGGRGIAGADASSSAWDIFLHVFPTSVVDAMARGDILQLVVFATFFGAAVAAIGAEGQAGASTCSRAPRRRCSSVTGYVMAFAPIGVFAAIAATVGGEGLGDPVHARQAGRA